MRQISKYAVFISSVVDADGNLFKEVVIRIISPDSADMPFTSLGNIPFLLTYYLPQEYLPLSLNPDPTRSLSFATTLYIQRYVNQTLLIAVSFLNTSGGQEADDIFLRSIPKV